MQYYGRRRALRIFCGAIANNLVKSLVKWKRAKYRAQLRNYLRQANDELAAYPQSPAAEFISLQTGITISEQCKLFAKYLPSPIDLFTLYESLPESKPIKAHKVHNQQITAGGENCGEENNIR